MLHNDRDQAKVLNPFWVASVFGNVGYDGLVSRHCGLPLRQ